MTPRPPQRACHSVIRLRAHAPNFVESDAHAGTPDDDCYYLFEYVSHKGPGFSRTNALIADLKIKPGDAAKDGENRKGQAIDRCAAVLRSALEPSWVRGTTFVPIPSRSEEHTSELQSLLRISYAVFCLKNNTLLHRPWLHRARN